MDFLNDYGSDDDRRAMDEDEEIIVRDVEDDSSNSDESDGESYTAEIDEAEVDYDPAISHFGSDLEYIAQQVQTTFENQTLPLHLQDTFGDIQTGDTENADSGSSDGSDESDQDEEMKEEIMDDDNDSDDDSDDDSDIILQSNKTADDDFGLTEEEEQLGDATAPLKTQHELDDDAALIPLPEAPEVLQLELGARKEQLRVAGEVMYRIDHEQTVVIQGILSSNLYPTNSSTNSNMDETDIMDAEGLLRANENSHHSFFMPEASAATYSLNEGTVLCTAEGVVVGVIHEVFGPVTAPFYIVRYRGFVQKKEEKSKTGKGKQGNNRRQKGKKKDNSQSLDTVVEEQDDEMKEDVEMAQDIQSNETTVIVEKEEALTGAEAVTAHFAKRDEKSSQERTLREIPSLIQPGVLVYTVPDHAVFLTPQFMRTLKTLKGSDASNAYDEEVGEDEIEYSDDEEEMKAKKALKDKSKRDKQPSDNKDSRKKVQLPSHLKNQTPITYVIPTSHQNNTAPIHVPIEHFLQQTQQPPQTYQQSNQYAHYVAPAYHNIVYPPSYPPQNPPVYQYQPLTFTQPHYYPPPPPPPSNH